MKIQSDGHSALPVKAANNFGELEWHSELYQKASVKNNKIKVSISEPKNKKYDTGPDTSLP